MATPIRSSLWPLLAVGLFSLLPSPAAEAAPPASRLRKGCLLVSFEPSEAGAIDFDRLRYEARMAARVLRIPGKRPPTADEVEKDTEGALIEGFTPLPGLPLDTSWDNVGWLPMGPGPSYAGDLNIAPNHPTSGAVSAIVPHPSDQNIVYLGTVNGGVWRTDNALATNPRWKPLTDEQRSLSIGGLTMDPTDPSNNTLVAAIGRRSSLAGLGGAHRGLLRTTDGGQSWTALGVTALAGRNCKEVAARGSTLLVAVNSTDNATAAGLYRSTDGGTTFTNRSGAMGSGLPAGAISFLASDPSNQSRFYLHVVSNGIYRSTDTGLTWTNISAGYNAAGVSDVALAVGLDGALFAAECAATSRVARSTNQGATWTALGSILVNMSSIFHGIAVDRSNSNLVYLSGLYTRSPFPYSGRVVRGNAAAAIGSQWTSIASTGLQGTGTAPHTDSRALAFTAGNRLLEGDDGGIYELNVANVGSEGTGTGGGGTWRSLNSSLQNSELHSMSYDPVARIFFGGAQDTGSLAQRTPGERLWDTVLTGDGGDVAIDVLTSPGQSIRYGSIQNLAGFYRRTYDANNQLLGQVFPSLILAGTGAPLSGMPFITPVVTNAVAGGRLILASGSALFESTDQGANVQQIANFGINSGNGLAYGGRSSGSNVPAVLFCASGTTINFRTTAGGGFTAVNIPGGSGTLQAYCFDPENWRSGYAVSTSAVFAANDLPTNGAAGLTNITGNLTGVGTLQTVTYLTLPSGNCIAVGTDLGVYLMRVASPGVWQTLGDNLARAPVYAAQFDAAGQVLAISTLGRGAWLYDFKQTKATGQYGETFQAFADGTATLPARVGTLFSNQLGTTAKVIDNNLHELALTAEGTQSTRTVFRLPDLNAGQPVTGFSVKWNAQIYGQGGALADGLSLNFGPLAGIAGATLIGTGYAQEDGFGVGLAVGVRTFSGNTPGYYVRVGGTVVPNGFVAKPTADWGALNPTRHLFEVDWRMDNGLTLKVDGVVIFTNLPTPGFRPAAGDVFAFAARTGQFFQETRLDNIVIVTGGVLTPAFVTTPYIFSTETAGATAANAFDGSAASRWDASDFTGHLGATTGFGTTIRAYTMTSGLLRANDPKTWDFQVGNDGVLFTQQGVQSAQYFLNAGESRSYLVASPRAASTFRVHVSESLASPALSIAELKPWAFQPTTAAFTVTSTASTGAGSLRQAIADAAPYGTGAFIKFDPALNGQTLTLPDGPIVISSAQTIAIDASSLPNGLTINAGGASRVFEITGRAVLRGLTLTGGSTNGFPGGGAILNTGTLLVENCTISGNTANAGGAVASNTPSDLVTGRTELRFCTLAGNSSGTGGAIYNYNGATFLLHCTISGNTSTGTGGGVASFGDANTYTSVQGSIVAQNSGGDVDFVFGGTNSFQTNGYSLIGTGTGTGVFNQPGDVVGANALLAPLGDYGGPTRTMALRPGSPARDAAFDPVPATTDQRGFAFTGPRDIGAYDAGKLANYNAFIWESLPVTASGPDFDANTDFDGDGQTNFQEWLAGTQPADRNSLFKVASFVYDGGIPGYRVSVQTVVGRNYIIEGSIDLQTWLGFNSFAGTGGVVSRTYNPPSKTFYRVRVSP
ncbi:MAG: hypothetical protein JSR82_05590 [Verrucomicrobia bacterium]|nr:hypothetical protein [Verrucomicrobiota bacterium]